MVYQIQDWTLRTLIDNYENNLINLNPPYQRGDIWTLPAKKRLIESIKLKYPLPCFFLYQNANGKFDMVDGQQRTRTIIGYSKGFFTDINKEGIQSTNQDFFYDEYKIAVSIITEAEDGEVEDFYYRVNKFGTKLNRPEILKAQFKNSVLQNLVERIASSSQFTSLSIFSATTLNRLSDLDFIGELLTLIQFGITDKKIVVDRFYEEESLTSEESQILERQFFEVLDDITRFNEIYEIIKTRYRQRNDFYTLFNFLLNHRELHKSTSDYQYRLLVLVDSDISPSQEQCFSFQEYAFNCVTQSNSKKAREERLSFFEELLLNNNSDPLTTEEPESTIQDVLTFYSFTSQDLVRIEQYFLVDIQKLNAKPSKRIFNDI